MSDITTAALAAEILASRATTPRVQLPACFACDRTYDKHHAAGNARFCSDRCLEAYDSGVPSHERQNELAAPYTRLSDGLMVACRGCTKQFRSHGLRCCSPRCEADHVRREADRVEIEAIRTQTGVAGPARWRACRNPDCGKRISALAHGAQKYCSRSCGDRHQRVLKARRAPECQNASDAGQTCAETLAAQGLAKAGR